MEKDIQTYRKALDDFRRARSKAAMRRFWDGIQGKTENLLPFNEISSKLHAFSQSDKGLQNIKLNAIVGSVGRDGDYDRNFRPLRDSDSHRWARVKTAMTSPSSSGVPPVNLYKIGDAYFVLDGNHRISIAKEMGMEEIEAYVTEVKTKVPISPSLTPQELLLKSQYVDFLEDSKLDLILPGIDFSLNLSWNYDLLMEHIEVHRYYMGLEQHQEISYEAAVIDWYDMIYRPVVDMIDASGLEQEYQDLTKTDLYLWTLDHQTLLQEELGMPIRTENVADFVAHSDGKVSKSALSRAEQHIEDTLAMDTGHESPGDSPLTNPIDCLFRDILVALGDNDESWVALEQAILVNRCTGGNIRGLHVVSSGDLTNEETHIRMQKRFEKRLEEAGIPGKLIITQGEISPNVIEHSLLSDLLVLKLNFPPTGGFFERLSSGILAILRKGRRPLMLVKEKAMPLDRILLAYDGSSQSKEALFISAYLTARYHTELNILTLDNGIPEIGKEVSYAKAYLEKLGLVFSYTFIEGKDLVGEVVKSVSEMDASLLVMGGYGSSSLFEKVFGSPMDILLDKIEIPVLLCR